jgi:hypothetical protein
VYAQHAWPHDGVDASDAPPDGEELPQLMDARVVIARVTASAAVHIPERIGAL